MNTKDKDSLSISSEDRELFRNAVKNSIPIKKNNLRVNFKSKPKARANQTRKDEEEVLIETLQGGIENQEKSTSQFVEFHRSGLSKKIIRKLQKGSYSIQAELDLHGMTVNDANEELKTFINSCVLHNYTCVRVIHGKGLGSGDRGPVLKYEVTRLLKKWKQVVAFVSARQVDGGTGAVYVLLKRNNK